MLRRIILETLTIAVGLFEEIDGVKYLPYKLMWGVSLKGYRRNAVQVSLHRSLKAGLLEKRRVNKKTYLTITDKGRDFLAQGSRVFSPNLSKDGSKWDGIYRFVLFDIPEKNRLFETF